MNYLSVCSGIEAATVAWHPLGWRPFAFAEIEKFPSAVLAHHYPSIPNLGDITKFKDWPHAAVDVLVGGTPCQSFSVAGLRKGLADPRGNLALTYLALADRYQPTWLLWENVPGVLSSGDGRDFGALLGGLGELGYGFAYRVLDAQYVRVDGFARAVPQRRRRVFVVGHLGDWRRAAAVLFERESLHWNSAPRRQAGERVAPTISSRPTGGGGLGTDFDCDGGLIAFGAKDYGQDAEINLAPTLRAGGHTDSKPNAGVMPAIAFNWQNGGGYGNANDGLGISEDHTPPVSRSQVAAVAFAENQRGELVTGDVMGSLKVGGGKPGQGYPAVAFQSSQSGVRLDDVHATLDSNNGSRRHNGVMEGWAVRRLTPRECERLQGFPDGYTAIPKAADGPRYKALGNSMAVNVMRWLGRRIEMVSALTSRK